MNILLKFGRPPFHVQTFPVRRHLKCSGAVVIPYSYVSVTRFDLRYIGTRVLLILLYDFIRLFFILCNLLITYLLSIHSLWVRTKILSAQTEVGLREIWVTVWLIVANCGLWLFHRFGMRTRTKMKGRNRTPRWSRGHPSPSDSRAASPPNSHPHPSRI